MVIDTSDLFVERAGIELAPVDLAQANVARSASSARDVTRPGSLVPTWRRPRVRDS